MTKNRYFRELLLQYNRIKILLAGCSACCADKAIACCGSSEKGFEVKPFMRDNRSAIQNNRENLRRFVPAYSQGMGCVVFNVGDSCYRKACILCAVMIDRAILDESDMIFRRIG
jgi:hypothetical protein